MDAKTLQNELNKIARRIAPREKKGQLIGTTIRKFEDFIFKKGFGRHYGIIVRKSRIYIVDKIAKKTVNEILIDTICGATTQKHFVYGIILAGGNNNQRPQNMERKQRKWHK